jgi:hypothetical protein
VEAHNEEEEQEVFATLNRIQNSRELNDDDDDDDSQTSMFSKSLPMT